MVDSLNDWGTIKLKKITSPNDFWVLFDELVDDESGLLHNRATILDAYKHEMLYGLYVVETDSMYERGARSDSIFCKDSHYMLPCFCMKEEPNCCAILWVHSRARRQGLGSKLVQLLGITRVDDVIDAATDFWNACGIDLSNAYITRSGDKLNV